MPIPVASRSKAWVRSRGLLGLRVRIPPGTWMSVVSVVCCQFEVSAAGRSLVQRTPTEYGVSECDLETSTMRSPVVLSTLGYIHIYIHIYIYMCVCVCVYCSYRSSVITVVFIHRLDDHIKHTVL